MAHGPWSRSMDHGPWQKNGNENGCRMSHICKNALQVSLINMLISTPFLLHFETHFRLRREWAEPAGGTTNRSKTKEVKRHTSPHGGPGLPQCSGIRLSIYIYRYAQYMYKLLTYRESSPSSPSMTFICRITAFPRCSGPPFSHAPAARMTVVYQTPSNESYEYSYYGICRGWPGIPDLHDILSF